MTNGLMMIWWPHVQLRLCTKLLSLYIVCAVMKLERWTVWGICLSHLDAQYCEIICKGRITHRSALPFVE